MESKTATSNDITFPVQGMSCGLCVRHIKAALAEAIRKSGYKPGVPRID